MNSTASAFFRDALIRQIFRGESLLSTSWAALTLRVPEANALGSALDEPVGGGYARMEIPFGITEWGLTGYNEVYNIDPIQFPTAGNYWGLIQGWALCDASTAGNTLAVGPVLNPLRVDIGDAPTIRSGGIIIGLTD